MKRTLIVAGPTLAVLGAVGLLMHGNSLIGMLDCLAFKIVDPPAPPPSSLNDLRWASIAGMTLIAAVVISCVAFVTQHVLRTPTVRLLQVGSGLLMVVGAVPLIYAVYGARQGFYVIAVSAAAPKPDHLQEIIRVSGASMTIGFVILVLSAVSLFAAGFLGWREGPSSPDTKPAGLSLMFAMGAVMVGGILLLLSVSIALNGREIGAAITQASTNAIHPAEFGSYFSGVLNCSLLWFVGLMALGAVQIMACLSIPLVAAAGEPKSTAGDDDRESHQ